MGAVQVDEDDAAVGAAGDPDGSLREILRLAVPALGALVAQPLFVLVDAAIVGTLGTLPLAGLGAAATLVSLVLGLCIFLAYATTSSVARRVGEGRWDAAVSEGVEGMALGLGLGVLLAVATWLLASPAVTALGASSEVTPYAVTYLHVVAFGFPAALVAMAGVGVLRGLQDTRTTLLVTLVVVSVNLALAAFLVLGLHLGIGGSAAATAAAETVQATAYVAVLVRVARLHGVALRPSGLGMLAAARTGGPLFARTVALRSVFLLAAAVAARLGDADLAAYHVSFQVWMLLALAADALAIAGMALLGRYLGSGDPRRRATRDRSAGPPRGGHGRCARAARAPVRPVAAVAVQLRPRGAGADRRVARRRRAPAAARLAGLRARRGPHRRRGRTLARDRRRRHARGLRAGRVARARPRPRRRRPVVGADLVHGRARRPARVAVARRRVAAHEPASVDATESAALGDAGG